MDQSTSRLSRILHAKITRKDLLTALGGLVAGVPLGAAGERQLSSTDPEGGRLSFAQGGEDIAADLFFQYVGLGNITYLDIGASDPVKINNTYFFYRKGGRGVLVEPNAADCERLRKVRPRDTTLNAGIGVTSAKSADFYVMSDPSWNTFSKEEAEHMEQTTNKSIRILKMIQMPLLNVNEVMQEHFQGAPSYLSIDAEGLHLAILKSIDFTRFRPPLICVETSVSGSRHTISEVPDFMAAQNYAPRGGSFVNTLFVDAKYT